MKLVRVTMQLAVLLATITAGQQFNSKAALPISVISAPGDPTKPPCYPGQSCSIASAPGDPTKPPCYPGQSCFLSS
jgi:hypothetical protein